VIKGEFSVFEFLGLYIKHENGTMHFYSLIFPSFHKEYNFNRGITGVPKYVNVFTFFKPLVTYPAYFLEPIQISTRYNRQTLYVSICSLLLCSLSFRFSISQFET